MSAYAVAHMRHVTMGPAVVEYLQRIDATLAPFGGRFIVHGGEVEVLEGTWPGHLIVIEFPDHGRARAWYTSDTYQQIVALRTDSSRSDVIVADGVGRGHRATDVLGAPSSSAAPRGS
jgi:uncharacterized protein (DUF1330 family)